jgi:hypothetical protein
MTVKIMEDNVEKRVLFIAWVKLLASPLDGLSEVALRCVQTARARVDSCRCVQTATVPTL